MIPAGLGNIVGGGLFVGVLYWYLYLTEADVEIPFDTMVYDPNSRNVQHGTPESTLMGAEGTQRGSPVNGIARELHVAQFKNEANNRHGSEDAV